MNGGSSTVANSSKNTNASPQTTTTTSASSIEQLKSTILRRKSLAATTSTSSNNNYNNIESKEHSDDTNSIQKRWPNQMPPPQQASDNFHSDDYRNVNYDAPNRNWIFSLPSIPMAKIIWFGLAGANNKESYFEFGLQLYSLSQFIHIITLLFAFGIFFGLFQIDYPQLIIKSGFPSFQNVAHINCWHL
ncbi:MAG: hypothetical protein MHMPM18_003235 [Marteilia pararefringens]